jgi:hypothetical protein
MGEGGAVLVLESLEHAQERNARILAEMSGYGTTNDAYHISAPAENGAGAAKCMQLALDQAGLDTGDIDYINAHGTSTQLNDQSETAAIKTVIFEQRAATMADLCDALDADFDGANECDDCDETNGSVYPNAPERCNGIDDDCDTLIDEDFDVDRDNYSVCAVDPALFDCNDHAPNIHPGALEDCGPTGTGNGVDENCNGYIDEGCNPTAVTGICESPLPCDVAGAVAPISPRTVP